MYSNHSSEHIFGAATLRPAFIAIVLVLLGLELLSPAGARAANPVLQLTASDPDGNNTGTARLGVPLYFTSVDTDTAHRHVDWKLQGAGTLIPLGGGFKPNATYTPPQIMPANRTVKVTAYLDSEPSVTTSYTFTLGNPVPKITSATPAELLTAGTQTLTLIGSGFVSGTTVALNAASYPATYVNYNKATVAIPVPGDAAGALTLQLNNPPPGGGAGSTFTESVAPNSIAVTASDGDAVNTGTAELGTTVNMTATESGSLDATILWSLTGAGSISSGGLYTPPAVMPANRAVTIQGKLASNPSIAASYSLTLINPVPEITRDQPDIIPAGVTTAVALTGTGFVPSTTVQVNGVTVPVTYKSLHSLVAQITVGEGATGILQVQADTTAFTGGTSNFVHIAVAAPVSLTAAARILDQTTFGPTNTLIQHVQGEGINAWLNEQFDAPQTVLAHVPVNFPSYCQNSKDCFESEWWRTVVTGNDQLRQRVAFALSQLFVTSSDTVLGFEMDSYANTLAHDAFANWYTIMNDVTLSPAMGIYLNMLNSAKPTGTLIANENFARENLQLFNLGLNLLNQDGSLQLDGNGNPIPAYTQAQVQAFARAYTGWTFANPDGSTPGAFTGTANDYHPLVPVEWEHDENPKTLLNGTTLPAGQSAEEDLAGALTNIFQHPNLPPFVSKQLIQHLVKSNPSPAYVARVASVFVDDGNNVRGNMKAVLRAILTDPEARHGDTAPQPSDGHLREPTLWMTSVMRGLGYVNVDPDDYWFWLTGYDENQGERPFGSHSVFNFFPPRYVIPGTTLSAPEFGLENTGSVVDRNALADTFISNKITGFNVDLSATSPLGHIAASQGPAALVTALNNLFLYGTMDSSTAAAITTEITSVTDPAQQTRLAAYLVITSSQYKVLH